MSWSSKPLAAVVWVATRHGDCVRLGVFIVPDFMTEPTSSQLLVQAMAHQHSGELDRAESLVRQILANDPENVPALTKLGVLSTANGQFETAEAIYRQVLILAPGDVGVLTILANFAVNRIAIGEAQDSFRQALARHPNHWQASLGLAGLLVDLGRTVEAVPILRDAIAARTSERADAPGLLDARALLAEILVTVGCDDEAQTLAQAVLAKEPDHCQALCALGDLLAESGQVELAEQAIHLCREYEPKNGGSIGSVGGAV